MTFEALTTDQRNLLSRAVTAARREAEAGAHEALSALGVGHHEPFGHMTSEERVLRNALREHGRQLGDSRDSKRGTQAIDRLAHEVAFEHWHRMLFARFLAENGLLIHPEHGVSVSIEDCVNLAKEEERDPWALAASFAQDMLPQIFRKDDPALSLALPTNRRSRIEKLLADLPAQVFLATDALGWTYQYWQSEKKAEVNAAGGKIGADELPAVTQLFTEDYMVDFLLDNTLGAWYAGKTLLAKPELAHTATSEDELRSALKLPGVRWKYLRFVKDEAGRWRPAAGIFEGWPETARELRCLDPCMGSGHFVVAMFHRLVAMRLAEGDLDEAAAAATVIRENIYGLELDPRCTQIAAFNVALAAWRRVGYCTLPPMNLACSGLAPNAKKEDWLKLAGDSDRLQSGMERLYQLFKDAPVLGSLIDPRAGEDDFLVVAFHELQPLLEKALVQEGKDDSSHEMAVTAHGLARAAEILAGHFTLVATNVPYLGRGKQNEVLADYCERIHETAKADLATCFVERCLNFCGLGGTFALVSPQNWLSLTSYKKLRLRLLQASTWNAVAKLGPAAFRDMNFWAANTALTIVTRRSPSSDAEICGLDVSITHVPDEKGPMICAATVVVASQISQLTNPDARIALGASTRTSLLQTFAEGVHGMTTGDSERMVRPFWESAQRGPEWEWFGSTVDGTCAFGGRSYTVYWQGGLGPISELPGARKDGQAAWGKPGVLVSQMNQLPVTLYSGELFDNNSAVIIPRSPEHLPAIWAFCSSREFYDRVREIDQKVGVTSATLVKIPFELARWRKVAAENYPSGLPKPFSSDPTQWLFNGHPENSDQPLHVAVARLLGYRWPRQTGSNFPDCPALGPDGLEVFADDDGIVPINPMRGEPPAEERLIAILRAAFTSVAGSFDPNIISKLIAATGSNAVSLTEWLLSDFFEQHCRVFHQRPFIWHRWDGRKDGFNVLVNYHRLVTDDGAGRQLLEKLTYAYLKDWIDRQEVGVREGTAGAEARLSAAIMLQKELKQILEGEAPYDIFVRWKPIAEQPIGWMPAVNDGVRLNIRPFLSAKNVGKKGAGILRAKPNVKWTKDRGNEPQSLRPKADYPWFWGCDPESNASHRIDFTGSREFTGERWNDLHYSLATKKTARAARKGPGQ